MFFPEFSSIKAGNDAFVFQLQGISLDCAFPDIWPMVWLKAPWIQHLFWKMRTKSPQNTQKIGL